MSKKHFKAIAEIFRMHVERPKGTDALALALELSAVFKSVNPRFDRDRFLRACGFQA